MNKKKRTPVKTNFVIVNKYIVMSSKNVFDAEGNVVGTACKWNKMLIIDK